MSQPLINGVLLPTLRSQVKIFIKHEITTSPLNGVQSADPRYSLKKQQNMRNYFPVCFSNTQVKTLISQPLF
ncbi:hypothetical protein B1P91_13195 [Enterococcus faecium]|nr:hypothetical protein B1P91_13195 [Enterococcus faecium]